MHFSFLARRRTHRSYPACSASPPTGWVSYPASSGSGMLGVRPALRAGRPMPPFDPELEEPSCRPSRKALGHVSHRRGTGGDRRVLDAEPKRCAVPEAFYRAARGIDRTQLVRAGRVPTGSRLSIVPTNRRWLRRRSSRTAAHRAPARPGHPAGRARRCLVAAMAG